MNEKTVKRLFDMQIDEVSLVDRPANQHASIAFSKAFEEDGDVSSYDEGFEGVDLDDLEIGDHVVDTETGEEFVVVEDDGIEKSGTDLLHAPAAATRVISGAGKEVKRRSLVDRGKAHLYRNQGRYKMAGAATGGAAVGYGASEMSKSLGETLLEELSKAASEDERSEIVAKAMNEVEIAKAAAAEAMAVAEHERDLRTTDMFISKAAEYNLPVAPEVLGPILKSMAATLDDDQLEVMDQLLTSVGDQLFEEVGFAGENDNNSVLEMVNAHAAEYVTKADVSGAQAAADIFEANPDLYDAYLAEKGI